jgi:hypothetical protein
VRRTRVKWWRVYEALLLVCCIAIVVFCAVKGQFKKSYAVSSNVTYTYDIKAGDTLWEVASNVATSHEDVREIIQKIMTDNNIKNAQEIKVGDRIYIYLERAK